MSSDSTTTFSASKISSVRRICNLNAIIDEQNALEKAMLEYWEKFVSLFEMGLKNELYTVNELISISSSSSEMHNQLALALLYGILASPESADDDATFSAKSNTSLPSSSAADVLDAKKYFYFLNVATKDSFEFLIEKIKQILTVNHAKLHSFAEARLFWLFSMLVEQNVPKTEELAYLFIRSIQPNSTSTRNLHLCSNLLRLFEEQRPWLYRFPPLIAASVYVFLRLIPEHFSVSHVASAEILFCNSVIRERFLDCLTIGRDFVRALMDVARIEQFDAILHTLLYKPEEMCPSLQSIVQILSIPPSKKVLAARIPWEMEQKLLFVMEHVKLGNQKPYQTWFSSAFFPSDDATSDRIIPDLIRYILTVFHPPNDLIQSNVVPRWAMIGWLLKSTRSYTAAALSKLALFFDWLFFEPNNGDSVMNLEPGILTIVNSAAKYPTITECLVEFLACEKNQFFPEFAAFIGDKLKLSMSTLLEKGVIVSFKKMFDAPNLSATVFVILADTFGELFRTNAADNKEAAADTTPLVVKKIAAERKKKNRPLENDSMPVEDAEFEVAQDADDADANASQSIAPAASFEKRLFSFLNLSGDLLTHTSLIEEWLCSNDSDVYNAVTEEKIVEKLADLIVEEAAAFGVAVQKMANLFCFLKLISVMLQGDDRTPHCSNSHLGSRIAAFIDKIKAKVPQFVTLWVCIVAIYNEDSFEACKRTLFSAEECLEAIFQVRDSLNFDFFYAHLHRFVKKFSFVVGSNNPQFLKRALEDMDPKTFYYFKSSLLACDLDLRFLFASLDDLVAAMIASLAWESFEQMFFWDVASLYFKSFGGRATDKCLMAAIEQLLNAINFELDSEAAIGLSASIVNCFTDDYFRNFALYKTLFAVVNSTTPNQYVDWLMYVSFSLAATNSKWLTEAMGMLLEDVDRYNIDEENDQPTKERIVCRLAHFLEIVCAAENNSALLYRSIAASASLSQRLSEIAATYEVMRPFANALCASLEQSLMLIDGESPANSTHGSALDSEEDQEGSNASDSHDFDDLEAKYSSYAEDSFSAKMQ